MLIPAPDVSLACVVGFRDSHSAVIESTRGTLLLIDLAGAKRVEVEAAASLHLKLAQEFCQFALGEARRYIAPRDVVEAVSAARSCAELARAFARSESLTAK